MIDLRPYEKLHTVQMMKDIIRKWWGVELAFADAKGYVLDHAEGKVIPPNNEFCRAALFSREGFRRCNESVKLTRDKLRAGGRIEARDGEGNGGRAPGRPRRRSVV